MKIRLSLLACFSVVTLLSAVIPLCCRGGMSRQKMSFIYGFDEWSPMMAYQCVATNWWTAALVGCLAQHNVMTNDMSEPSAVVNLFWETNNPAGDGTLLVVETTSFSSAVDVMMQRFSQCAAPQPFPRSQGVYASIGDICFTGYPLGCSNSFDYVRNNVYVSVEATDHCIASNLAFTIDAAILNASTNTPGR